MEYEEEEDSCRGINLVLKFIGVYLQQNPFHISSIFVVGERRIAPSAATDKTTRGIKK